MTSPPTLIFLLLAVGSSHSQSPAYYGPRPREAMIGDPQGMSSDSMSGMAMDTRLERMSTMDARQEMASESRSEMMSRSDGRDMMSGSSMMSGMDTMQDMNGRMMESNMRSGMTDMEMRSGMSSAEMRRDMEMSRGMEMRSGTSDMEMRSGMSDMEMSRGMEMRSGMSGMEMRRGMSDMERSRGMEMRSGMSDMEMRSGMSGMEMRSGMSGMEMRSGMSNMERSGISSMEMRSNMEMRSGTSDMEMTRGMSNMERRSGMSDMEMRRGMSDMERSGMSSMEMRRGMSDMEMRSGMSDMEMRSGMSDMEMRRGMSDMEMRSGMSDMERRSGMSDMEMGRGMEMRSGTSDMEMRRGMSDMERRSGMSSAEMRRDMEMRSGTPNMEMRSGMSSAEMSRMEGSSMMTENEMRQRMGMSGSEMRPEASTMEGRMGDLREVMMSGSRDMSMSGMPDMNPGMMREMMPAMMKEAMESLGTSEPVPVETRNTGDDHQFYHTAGRDSAAKFHYSFSRQNDGQMVTLLSDRAHVLSSVCKGMAEMMNAQSARDVRDIMDDPSYQDIMRREFSPYCYQLPRCDPTQKYRSACGACNNLKAPLYGKAFTPFRRIVESAYEDGVETPSLEAPRTGSRLGGSLPSARDVSNAVHNERVTSVNSVITPFVTTFGQFLDHDFTSTPLMEDENGNFIDDCCSNPERFECFSIPVSTNDGYFTDPSRKCIHVVRSDSAPPLDCSSGIRQQQNQRSAFIDGTMIYGFNRAKEDSLRIGELGFLKVSDEFPDTQGLMPKSGEDNCNILDDDRESPEIQHCFDAGDHRHTENPLLTVIHTAFLRRHNLIATLLRETFGVTDDEILFQEAKRMVIAELQHITYNEFLPIVLNKKLMRMYNLKISKPAHDDVYNASTDPRIINSFSTAVFRFGHSLVRQVVGSDNGDFVYLDNLHKHFDRPRMALTGKGYGHEYVINWKARTGCSQPDASVVDAIRNKLFESETSSLGGATLSFDLVALNIQRGRDHGLPGYNVYREWCGLPRVRHFGTWKLGLVDHDGREASKLRAIYKHPDDIDLFSGGLSERRIPGSLLGPTFACILAYQFQQLKVGDRYWYENPHPIHGFTTEQVKELKKVSLAKVICSTAEEGHLMNIQPNLMIRVNSRNSKMTCNEILGGGHELGYHIDVFGTNFPGRRRPQAQRRNMQRPIVRGIRRIYPYNPTLQHLFRNRLHIKSLGRKVVIPLRRKYRRRILVSRRRPLRFRRIVRRKRLPKRIVIG